MSSFPLTFIVFKKVETTSQCWLVYLELRILYSNLARLTCGASTSLRGYGHRHQMEPFVAIRSPSKYDYKDRRWSLGLTLISELFRCEALPFLKFRQIFGWRVVKARPPCRSVILWRQAKVSGLHMSDRSWKLVYGFDDFVFSSNLILKENDNMYVIPHLPGEGC